jgi:uncharacterized membrane protein required for colicin V production
MMPGLNWADAAIFIVLAIATFKGFRRGFVRELGGLVAIAAGLIAPWYYNGSADAQIEAATKFSAGAAHVTGMVLTGIFAYVVVIVLAAILNRIAKLPILGTINALAGAAAGLVKGAIFCWVVLFIALFFPLTPPIRTALHQSVFAGFVDGVNAFVDLAIVNVIPSFAKAYVLPIFAGHHV